MTNWRLNRGRRIFRHQQEVDSLEVERYWLQKRPDIAIKMNISLMSQRESAIILLLLSSARYFQAFKKLELKRVKSISHFLFQNQTKLLNWSHFVLDGLNYYVIRLKLIIWYNALIVYIHVLTLYLYFKKNACINLNIPPNLPLTLPESHINSSKSVFQYNMNTISTLYFFFFMQVHYNYSYCYNY